MKDIMHKITLASYQTGFFEKKQEKKTAGKKRSGAKSKVTPKGKKSKQIQLEDKEAIDKEDKEYQPTDAATSAEKPDTKYVPAKSKVFDEIILVFLSCHTVHTNILSSALPNNVLLMPQQAYKEAVGPLLAAHLEVYRSKEFSSSSSSSSPFSLNYYQISLVIEAIHGLLN